MGPRTGPRRVQHTKRGVKCGEKASRDDKEGLLRGSGAAQETTTPAGHSLRWKEGEVCGNGAAHWRGGVKCGVRGARTRRRGKHASTGPRAARKGERAATRLCAKGGAGVCRNGGGGKGVGNPGEAAHGTKGELRQTKGGVGSGARHSPRGSESDTGGILRGSGFEQGTGSQGGHGPQWK